MKTTPFPRFAFEIWCGGIADEQCAGYLDLPIHPLRRWFWRVRGGILTLLFGWRWWK